MRILLAVFFSLFLTAIGVAQQGASTQAYFYELIGKLSEAQKNNDGEVAVPTVLEMYRVWRAGDWHPEQDDAIVLGQLSSVAATTPNHPLLREFQREELPRLRAEIDREGSPAEKQLLGILDLLPTFQRHAENAATKATVTTSISYPNALDTGGEVMAFLRELPASLPLSVLPHLNAALENDLLRDAKMHEDAVVNYAANHPEATGGLLNYSLQREQFLAQREARAVAEHRLARTDWAFGRLHATKEKKEKELRQRLHSREINPYAYQTALQKLTDGAYAEAFASAWSPAAPPSWEAVRAALQPEQAVVKIYRYVVRENARWRNRIAYGAVLLRPAPHPPEFVALAGGDSLEFELYHRFQEEIFSVPSGQSFGRFWAPIAAKLPGVKQVFYVPDGIFRRINPGLLYREVPDRYLLEDVSYTFASSLAAIVRPGFPVEEITDALLLGNPDYGTGSWLPLPNTEAEVAAARASLLQSGGVSVRLLTGNEATENRLRSAVANKQLLHFATHAYFRPYATTVGQLAEAAPTTEPNGYPSALNFLRDERGRRTAADREAYQNWLQEIAAGPGLTAYLSADSLAAYRRKLDEKAGIVLAGVNAPGPHTDGLLLRSELAELDLAAARMVILSACDIGRGDLSETIELGGFQQDFRAHGVRYLISSLWPVQDRAGGAFMTAFYRHWAESGRTPEAAFTAAQRELIAAGEPLYYWGGFILTKL
ncbi:MAG: CHAT domain-containing protein [Bacteroidota bacterium]